jgi:hypothetical protein
MSSKSNVRVRSLIECVEEPISKISMQEAAEEDAFTYVVGPYASNPEIKCDVISYRRDLW